jgi:MFS family permease
LETQQPVLYPATRSAAGRMAVLALLGFFLSTDISLTTMLIEPMKREMALSDIQIGLLQGTAFGLAFGLGSIPLGRLVDRFSRTRMLLLGIVAWIAAMVGTAWSHGIIPLMCARVVLGLVAALTFPAVVSLIADLFPPERRSIATSLFAVGQACGQGFGILVGGLAFDALMRASASHGHLIAGMTPWRSLYLAAGLLGLPLLIALIGAREPDRLERTQDARSIWAALGELWQYRGFVAPLLAAMLFSTITVQAAQVWATPVLIRDYNLTPGQFAEWLSATTLLGGILGSMIGGQLGELGRRRFGRGGVLLPALIGALLAAPLSMFAVVSSLPVFAAMLGLDLLMGAVLATLGVVAIALVVPNEIRGIAVGANIFVSAVFGSATAPAAIAFASQLLGGEAMLGRAIAAVALPSALFAAVSFGLAMRGARRLAA